LFDGYWDDPAASAQALVRDPLQPRSGQLVLRTGDLAERGPDGDLFFLGRVDSQVQIRGNRVELGEVERRLLEYPGVSGAVALVRPGPDGDPALTAFLVLAQPEARVDLVRLRAFCRQTLPEYMAPRDVHVIPALPLTRNGKTDRAALTGLVPAQD
jgi:acyl-coenzyme A synthetase/AMP-(fatty) acid ligase